MAKKVSPIEDGGVIFNPKQNRKDAATVNREARKATRNTTLAEREAMAAAAIEAAEEGNYEPEGGSITLEIGEPENVPAPVKGPPPSGDVDVTDVIADDNEDEYVPEDEQEPELDDEDDEHAAMLSRRAEAHRKAKAKNASEDDEHADEAYVNDEPDATVDPSPPVVRRVQKAPKATPASKPMEDEAPEPDEAVSEGPGEGGFVAAPGWAPDSRTEQSEVDRAAAEIARRRKKSRTTKHDADAPAKPPPEDEEKARAAKLAADLEFRLAHSPWNALGQLTADDAPSHTTFIMGDRIKIRHPLTGESMTMAVTSFCIDEDGTLSVLYGPVAES
jgi:hypothetical protein